jgi:hypothetical protein
MMSIFLVKPMARQRKSKIDISAASYCTGIQAELSSGIRRFVVPIRD